MIIIIFIIYHHLSMPIANRFNGLIVFLVCFYFDAAHKHICIETSSHRVQREKTSSLYSFLVLFILLLFYSIQFCALACIYFTFNCSMIIFITRSLFCLFVTGAERIISMMIIKSQLIRHRELLRNNQVFLLLYFTIFLYNYQRNKKTLFKGILQVDLLDGILTSFFFFYILVDFCIRFD